MGICQPGPAPDPAGSQPLEENHQESTAGSLITAQGWDGPASTAPGVTGRGKGRQRIPRNDAARHSPKSRTGRGWRNLPWSTPGTCWSIHSIPCRPYEFPGRARTEEFRACDKHPFNPALFHGLKTVGKTRGAPLPEPWKAFQPGTQTGSRGCISPHAQRCSPGMGGGHFWGFPCARGAAGMAGLGINSA